MLSIVCISKFKKLRKNAQAQRPASFLLGFVVAGFHGWPSDAKEEGVSRKINYDALSSIFDDDGSFATAPDDGVGDDEEMMFEEI